MRRQRRYDMNGRSQMQGGKKCFFAERDECKAVLLGLSLAGNLEKPLMKEAWLWTQDLNPVCRDSSEIYCIIV
jgi:hypothetical protein